MTIPERIGNVVAVLILFALNVGAAAALVWVFHITFDRALLLMLFGEVIQNDLHQRLVQS